MSEPITLYNDEGGSLVLNAPGYAADLVASGLWSYDPVDAPPVAPEPDYEDMEQEDEEARPVPLKPARKRKAGG